VKINSKAKSGLWGYLYLIILLCFIPWQSKSQAPSPPNDNCSNISEIVTSNKGYGYGTFSSLKINLKNATRQSGESFTQLHFFSGQDIKSVWYKFSIPVHRQVIVQLRQKDTMINQNAVGFAVYRADNCLPNLGEITNKLPAISKFGASENTCLDPGDYMIQVCANQSANDTIWIDLGVAGASDSKYDVAVNAFNMGVVQGIAKMVYDVGCLSIDSLNEVCSGFGSGDSAYNQTAWAVFKTPVYSDAFNFSFTINNKYSADSMFGYKLYEGNATTGTPLKLIGSCNVIKIPSSATGPYYNFIYPGNRVFCNVKQNTTYTLQIFSWAYAQYSMTLTVSDFGQDTTRASDPKHLPGSYKLGSINSGATASVFDFIACNARMNLHQCGTIMPTYIIDSFYETNSLNNSHYYIKDTLNLCTWLTFNIKEAGIINISSIFTTCPYEPYLPRYFILYKGDATLNCNLPIIFQAGGPNGFGNICLEPGTYSYQVLTYTERNLYSDFCYDVDLGKTVVTTLNFTAKVTTPPSKYHLPPKAQDMGDISPTLKSKGIVYGNYDYFDSIVQIDTITGYANYGYFLYRQFYLSTPAHVQIKNEHVAPPEVGDQQWDGALYAGKITDGISTLKSVSNGFRDPNSGDYYADTCFFRSGCTKLPVGWYTVQSRYSNNQCYLTSIPANNIAIDTFAFCKTSSYNTPAKAGLINNLAALGPGVYSLPVGCISCSNDTPFTEKIKPCKEYKLDSPYTHIGYFVFNLKQESYVVLFGLSYWLDANYLLYRGNANQDSSILGDPSKSIKPCKNSNEFCRLQPGYYTIVGFYNSVSSSSYGGTIYIDQTVYSKFDYATNACDLGMIPMDGSIITSPTDYIGCTTGAFKSDPGFYSNDTSVLYYGSGKSTVPYPMPVNYNKTDVIDSMGRHAPRNVLRNIWYTFTMAGIGDFNIQVFEKNDLGSILINYLNSSAVYKSNKNGNIPFKNLVATNQVDSTFAQGLQYTPYDAFTQNFTPPYLKAGCDTTRYYMVLYDNQNSGYLNHQYYISVSYNGSNYPQAGDYCSNAIPMILNGIGDAIGTATVNCHTTGESFGEDGSNMGCLNGVKPYKTTWFKVTQTQSNKADLTFRIINRTNSPTNEISYRVLYGNCDAMTPGPCVSDANASFTLDCMGKGDYYIQVSEPASASGQILLLAGGANPAYPVCKPASLFQPLANFYTTGGCNGTPINFINLSSAGSDIIYHWNFGNGKTSSLKSPIITFNSSKSIDTFLVTLSVRDTVHGAADSLSLPVYVFKDPITLKVIHSVTTNCTSPVQLTALCNYSNALFYWTPASLLDNAYISNPTASISRDTTFYLTVVAEGCTLYDSVRVKIDQKLVIGNDFGFCKGNTETLFGPPGYYSYTWTDGKTKYTTQDIIITKPGKYSLLAQTNRGCTATDTISINGTATDSIKLGRDTTICSGTQLKIKIPYEGRYLWNNGDTDQAITVRKGGKYMAIIKLGACTLYGNINVTIQPFPLVNAGGTDTSFCIGDSGILSVGYLTGTRYRWSTGDTLNFITVKKSGTYSLQISNGHCDTTINKIVTVEPIPNPNLGKDTSACRKFTKTLDAGPGLSYKWFPDGETTREITVNAEGKYAVFVSNGIGCEKTDTIMLTMHCEDATLFVPNSFTPDGNGKNDIFKAEGTHIGQFKMSIYNRWGELIFESNDINTGWDGTFRKMACPMDVYLWVIDYTGLSSEKMKSGTVTLLR